MRRTHHAAERAGTVSFKLQDVEAFARGFASFGEKTQESAKKELRTPAEALLEEVRSQLNRPGTGRVYSHGRGRLGARLHQASRPGEPPAPDTGALRDSARVEPHGDGLRVVVDGASAGRLEFGARDLAPRPYMRPALNAAKARMTRSFGAKLKRGR